jgi:hypothetical protein
MIRWLLESDYSADTRIGSINSGVTQAMAQLTQEREERITADATLQVGVSSGGGTGTSNSTVYRDGLSSGATWVTIATVTLTPTGAGGDYTIDLVPNAFINGALSAGTVFNGNWKVTEELTGGGTEHTLESGTFTVTYTPESSEGGEGGDPIVFPEYWTVEFTGLPSGLIAANEAAQVDIKLQIQRASGTNNVTAPGLSGSMTVEWTP